MKLFSKLEDIFYDSLGYLVPGFCHFCVTAVMQITILIVKPFIPKLLVCLGTAFFYLTFYYEMQRHRILSEKELYLYINYLLEEKQE